MKSEINIESFDTYVYIKFTGDIAVTNVMGVQQYLYLDPHYQKVLAAIFDFSEVKSLSDGGKEVMKMAMNYMAKRPFETPAKVALLGVTDIVSQLVETYRIVTKDGPVSLEVFATRKGALTWLGQ